MKLTEPIKTWAGVQIPGSYLGHTVCTATHPDMPNYSGHSRGRKIHLMKTMEKTFCNMLVDKLAPTEFKYYSMTSNGACKNCLNAIKR